MIRTIAIAVLGSVAMLSPRQPAPAVSAPAFEVASVKVSRQIDAGIMRKPTPGRVFFQNVPLDVLVEEAFGVKAYQVIGMPAWTGSERFDIAATHDPALSKQVPSMLQRLLEERFSLRTRREIRELPIYELVRMRADGALGPGLRLSTTECARPAGQRSPCTLRIASGSIEGTGTRWGFLPTNIGVWDRPVIDKTGLSGSYDVKLEWTSDAALARSPETAAPAAVSAAERPSIFTALQEQLGLKLEPARGPVEVIVIDSVERPTPD
jgi:uncharacterized protein (TIGR03435 family)